MAKTLKSAAVFLLFFILILLTNYETNNMVVEAALCKKRSATYPWASCVPLVNDNSCETHCKNKEAAVSGFCDTIELRQGFIDITTCYCQFNC
ncbi:hypothetical protein LWI29_000876 [Acer saccharum]|uniref:Uncharacterized protein n=1 Tax=Acer saccharum TaxID=4024 RepID=A0AA39RU06_ACESA|nr:hypothetical protein LWI29_000876 [Acer saccharum]KAK1572056.1 hypothetical protein Q3G72_026956 [Acer saccharum]